MQSRHVPMTIEAFHRLPWELGWKYEYWDACAHISPREHVVCVSTPVAPRAAWAPWVTRTAEPGDARALRDPYLAAFRDGIEYCDREEQSVIRDAAKTIDGFFAGGRGRPLLASRIALGRREGSSAIVGAALVVDAGEGRARLDVLFVEPAHQRQDIATALVSEALSALYRLGFQVLESRYMLGNAASEAWHRRFGFQLQPDLQTARLMAVHFRHEVERLERARNAEPALRRQLTRELARWRKEVQRLEEVADSEGLEAVTPLLRSKG